jgi:hypothetical protein
MIEIFLFCLIVSGGLLSLSVVADVFDLDAAHHEIPDTDGHSLNLLSVRTTLYFLFAFGGVGTVLSWAWKGRAEALVLILAALAGLTTAYIAALLFRYLRRTESGGRAAGEDGFVGLPATISVPLSHEGAGKVVVQRGERSFELIARPHEPAAMEPRRWSSVVIVEMRQGVALVAPVDDTLHLDSPD